MGVLGKYSNLKYYSSEYNMYFKHEVISTRMEYNRIILKIYITILLAKIKSSI